MALKFVLPVALAVALAGCGSIGAINFPWKRDGATTSSPETLPSATAVAPVDSSDIGPPGGTTIDGTTGDVTDNPDDQSLSPPGGQTASVAPGTTGSIGRTDLLGGWTITSGSDSCQLFMTLTSWTGGYRASTRGCTDATLKSISAWNLEGSDVVLAGQGGAPIARLTSSGNNRFDGQANGQGVTFFR